MNPAAPSQTKFDPIKIIAQAFSYVQHVRLMLLMLALGLCAGATYFLFSKPLYRSTSLIYARSFSTPLQDSSSVPEVNLNSLSRSFRLRFNTPLIRLGAAKRLGLVGEEATSESVLQHVPTVRIAMYDATHLEVTVFAYEPEVVRTFAEAMVEEFQGFQQQSWQQFRDEALDRYAVQLAELETQVEESIDALTDVDRDTRLTEVTIEQKSLLEIPKNLVETREKLARMDGIRLLVEKLSGEIAAQDSVGQTLTLLSLLSDFETDTAVDVGDVVSAPVIGRNSTVNTSNPSMQVVEPQSVQGITPWRELEKEKRLLESQLAEASKTYLAEHQVIKDLSARLSKTIKGLDSELKVLREKFELEYSKLQEQVSLLESRMPEYERVTRELGKSANSYQIAANNQKMWDKARDEFTSKIAAINFNEDFDWVQVRFKQFLSLRDEVPVSPAKSKLAIISLMIGLAGALGVPTVLNLFNTSASTVQQLEEYTGLKGIGIVPLTSKDFLEDVHRSPAQGATVPNYLLECFRVIRSNICLRPNHHQRSQVVLVTSARPQEGKTTQSANLAWAFHSMGERTLLIDCDLRRGRVHGLLNLENQNGMTRLLMGEITVQEAIHPTPQENFDAIPRGPVIAGTTEILCQKPFEDLIALFRKHYDRIVIDSPPVLGLSESSSLQRVVDGTVLVVRAEKTSRKDVMDAITLLRNSDAHFFGFVLNAVDLSKASNYYYYYYYSAPYYDQFGADEDPPNQPSPRPTSRPRPVEENPTPAGPRERLA